MAASEDLLQQNAEAGPSSTPRPAGGRYRLAHSLSAHTRAVTALQISNDGRTLISAGADGYLHFWDPRTGRHLRSLRAHRQGINDLSLSPDSLYVCTAADDGLSHIYTAQPLPSSLAYAYASQADPSIPRLNGHGNAHPDPDTDLLTESAGRAAPLRVLAGHTAPVLACAFSPKSNLLATGSFDESAIVWDVRRGRALRTLPAHSDAVWTVGWDGEGGMVLTGSADGLIRLWDANTGQCFKTFDNDDSSPVSYASITPSSFFLLSSTLSSTLRIYNMYTSKVLKTLTAPGTFISEKHPCPALLLAAPVPGVASSAHPAQPVANGVAGEHMEVDRPTVGEPLVNGVEGSMHDTLPDSLTRRRPEAWIVTGSENGKVVIFDLGTRQVVQVLEASVTSAPAENQPACSPVVALAVSKDGRTIISGSLEPSKMIHVWQMTDA